MSNYKQKENNSQEDSKSKHDTSAWLVPYGNMMTILMIFFLSLYGLTYMGQNKLVSNTQYEKNLVAIQKDMIGKEDKEAVKRIEEKESEIDAVDNLERYIKEEKLNKFAEVEIDAQQVKVRLTNPILFDSGKAEIKVGARKILGEIIKLAKKIPNHIMVEGHTDNVPIYSGKYKSNWELSAARAFNVIKYFIDEESINPERLSALGAGEYQPLVPNDSDENKARNRRIVINIMRSSKEIN